MSEKQIIVVQMYVRILKIKIEEKGVKKFTVRGDLKRHLKIGVSENSRQL